MITLKVEGMTCGHCVKAVTGAIQALDPKAQVTVDLPTGTLQAETALGRDRLAAAVVEEGYKVVG